MSPVARAADRMSAARTVTSTTLNMATLPAAAATRLAGIRGCHRYGHGAETPAMRRSVSTRRRNSTASGKRSPLSAKAGGDEMHDRRREDDADQR